MIKTTDLDNDDEINVAKSCLCYDGNGDGDDAWIVRLPFFLSFFLSDHDEVGGDINYIVGWLL